MSYIKSFGICTHQAHVIKFSNFRLSVKKFGKFLKKRENTKNSKNNVYVFTHLKAHLGEYKLIVLSSHPMGVIKVIYKKLHDLHTSGTRFGNFQNP